jgi:putative glycosyltransferase (TIGR04348 family)
MDVVLVCKAPRGSRLGNRITALRWTNLLRELGHHVVITSALPRGAHDVVVALHARLAAEAVRWSRQTHPSRPIVLALTGTDLYRDIHHDADAKRSLALADRLVVLHERAPLDVPEAFRAKVRVIRQSAPSTPNQPRARRQASGGFNVAFVAHLRAEKDPLRAAAAVRLLPATSSVRIVHVGRALSENLGAQAIEESRMNPRYEWLGEVTPARALRLIAGSKALLLTSLMEGGANVLGEAIMAGVPPITSRIPAAVAALGEKYPGFFPVGDTRGLARLLTRAEREPSFLAELVRQTRARRPLFTARAEKSAWRALLAELRPKATRARSQ